MRQRLCGWRNLSTLVVIGLKFGLSEEHTTFESPNFNISEYLDKAAVAAVLPAS